MLPGSSRTSTKMMTEIATTRGDEGCESLGDEAIHGCERVSGGPGRPARRSADRAR